MQDAEISLRGFANHFPPLREECHEQADACHDAIALLKEHEEKHKILLEQYDTAHKLITKLLKEQEAVKPFIQISEHTGRKWLTCGACEYTIASEKESWDEINFCPKCGKPILLEGR